VEFLDIKLTVLDQFYIDWLDNWSYLNMRLTDKKSCVNEYELKVLMKLESINSNRSDILKRLKSRYDKLRNKREWTEILNARIKS
jgi:hypothetical protein